MELDNLNLSKIQMFIRYESGVGKRPILFLSQNSVVPVDCNEGG